MIRYACPRCQSVLEAPDDQANFKLPCPKCGQRLQIPTPPPNKTMLAPLVDPNRTMLGRVEPGNTAAPSPPSVEGPASVSSSVPSLQFWYYRRDRWENGPVSQQDMQAKVRRGEIRPLDLVWTPGITSWTPAERYFEFRTPWLPAWGRPGEEQRNGGDVCSILSCVFGAVAFLLCPPLFGLAGLVLGIIGVCLGQNKAVGVVGIVLSVVGTVVGMLLGVAIATARFH
jgi:hypothetical protein